MKPLNYSERKSIITRFLLIYGSSLAIVLLAAYLLFHSPISMIKERLETYKKANASQEQLIKKGSTIAENVSMLVKNDEDYNATTNDITKGNIIKKLNEYEKNVEDGVAEIKRDSTAQRTSPLVQANAKNYISAFDAVTSYRNSLQLLRKTMEDKNIDVSALSKLTDENKRLQEQVNMLTMMANNKSGGTVDVEKQKMIQQLQQLQQELANCKDDLTKLKNEKSTPVPVANTGPTSADKANVLFEQVDGLIKKVDSGGDLIYKKGLLFASREILDDIKNIYPDKNKLKDKQDEVTGMLKKMGSF